MDDWLDANFGWFGWVVGIVVAIAYVAGTRNRRMPLWQHVVAVVVIGVVIGLGLGVLADLLE